MIFTVTGCVPGYASACARWHIPVCALSRDVGLCFNWSNLSFLQRFWTSESKFTTTNWASVRISVTSISHTDAIASSNTPPTRRTSGVLAMPLFTGKKGMQGTSSMLSLTSLS